ncbi:MAG: HIT family protein [Candidatus Thioglobus sp.]|nr:MAG: HIT family protein [Candidatus Thioglobus sp.]
MSKDCIFCKLKNERIIGECELTKSFIDSYPASAGHTLIVPKRHFANYFEATDDELLALGKAVQNAKKILDQEFAPDAYNIGINNGKPAGQSVMHLHIHLIPRYIGDVENPKGGVRWVLKNKANYWDEKSAIK